MPTFPHLPVLDFPGITKNFETLGNLPHLPVTCWEDVTRNFEVLDPSVPCLPVRSFHDATLDFEMLSTAVEERPRPQVTKGFVKGPLAGTAFLRLKASATVSVESLTGLWGFNPGNWGEGTGYWAEGLVQPGTMLLKLKASASTSTKVAGSAKTGAKVTATLAVTVKFLGFWGTEEGEWGEGLRNWGE